VAYYLTDFYDGGEAYMHLNVDNRSDAPIYEVYVPHPDPARRGDHIMQHDVLLPGNSFTSDRLPPVWIASYNLLFKDNAGRWWRRYPNGRLFEEPKGNGPRAWWVRYRAGRDIYQREGFRARFTIRRVLLRDRYERWRHRPGRNTSGQETSDTAEGE
jgi:hypothetical protein